LLADRVMRLLKPSAQFVVQILLGPDPDEMAAPSRTAVGGLDDAWAVDPAMQREGGQETFLAGTQPSEPDPGHTDKPGLLRDDLDVAERAQQLDVAPSQLATTATPIGRSKPAGTARLRRSQRSSASAADSPRRNSRLLTATSPGPTGPTVQHLEKQAVGPRLFVDAILEDRPLRPDFGDGHAVQCVVEAALRTERTSMGFAPGAELSVLRRRS